MKILFEDDNYLILDKPAGMLVHSDGKTKGESVTDWLSKKYPALENIGGFNTDIKFYGEDTDIARRIKNQGQVIFTYDLPMHTSARRLKKEGLVKMGLKYAADYFWIIIFKKPFNRKHQDVRE